MPHGRLDHRPIGVFDSGFGGLTVARALIDLVPSEDLVYVGDTGRYPYGPRSLDEVAGFAHQIGRFLVSERDVKLLVVACNTATAAALGTLRDELPVPVVGVIDPGVRSLLRATESGRVGVIGTVGTVRSGAYQRAVACAARETGSRVDLTVAACPGFVEFVEQGETDTDQVMVLAERLLAPVMEANVDALLLGCTHYPYLARTLSDVVGRDVVLVSSAEETAFEVRSMLDGVSPSPFTPPVGRRGDDRRGTHCFVSSGDVGRFEQLGSRLLGPELVAAERAPWSA